MTDTPGAYLRIKSGRVGFVPFGGIVQLRDITEEVGSPFGVFMATGEMGRRRVQWLCNDEALIRYDEHLDAVEAEASTGRMHEWALSFVRPWDGRPIAGPLMVVILDMVSGYHLPLPAQEASRIYDGLMAIGFRPE